MTTEDLALPRSGTAGRAPRGRAPAAAVPRQPARAADASRTASPLVYRSVLDVPGVPGGTGIIPEVRRVTACWLADKKRFDQAPLETGTHRLDERTVLMSQALYHPNGTEHALRIQLREDNEEATWRVTVTAVTPAGAEPQSAAVTLECFDNGVTALNPGRPALVEQLVDALRPRDGRARLTVHAQAVSAAGVDELVHVLCDPDRRLPAVVAARPLHADDTWSRRLRQLMPKCSGDASLYLLCDADAVGAFREAVGEHHRIAPGAVRTYLPEVDPAWSADAPRHRLLSGTRISDPRDQAFRLVSRGVHRHALERQAPARLRTLVFPDEHQRKQDERRAAQDAARAHVQAPHVALDELASLKEENAILTQLLAEGDQDLSEAARRELLAERTIQALQQQLHQVTARYQQEMEDHLLALEDVERAQSETRLLRQRLHAQGRHEDTVILEPAAAQPSSFEELWERLGELDHVLVTAERSLAIGLDDQVLARTWAAKAWQALRSLDSYAAAQKEGLFSGGYFQFCKDVPVAGARIFPVKQIAMGETEATRTTWGDERIFPVPAELAPGGRMQMLAHLKLGSKGSISPRVYFHDDSRGGTGRVIVGYIGPHLTNRKTS
ncbi:hypothetical protein ACH414_15520 [Streptomyces sp. NPDC020422]|uniref:hypothetical protein n=1 Tax=unclassified Streptomyces TaxID=2593676 RepID=UPI0036F697E5